MERTLSSQTPAPSAEVSAYVQRKPLGAVLLQLPSPQTLTTPLAG